MVEYNERDIIEQLKNPECVKDAFGKVIAHYTEPLYWHIRKLVLNHDDANDVLQNTFLKAWSSIEYFRGDAKMSTWLYRIATNEAITFLSKEQGRNTASIDDMAEAVKALAADEWFDGNDLQLKLQEAVAQLPEKQRLVFNMRYFDEMKYEDISEILGTSVGALKASFHHAVKKIESFFE
ncbi:MAG: sigma-70 family RNA polymerase sigma factor [Candidatus Limisoma sp.]|nr:sigma-70 family RNA polymerase sigma factor [Muribaculaceae bacterium]MDY5998994.1 sigma-70 family RNA polymerase sigma factor [Candidatus Limisoma sp.]